MPLTLKVAVVAYAVLCAALLVQSYRAACRCDECED